MTHGSLFSGIGGFDLAFASQGIPTIWQVEQDAYCQKVLRKHFPETELHNDVRTVGRHNLTPVSIISGGFPCQDISVAGRQAGLDGARSGLWFEMLRVISELRPRWVLVENVPNLRTKGIDTVIDGLEAEGYTCWPSVVGAWAAGASHKRDRLWLLAHTTRSSQRESSNETNTIRIGGNTRMDVNGGGSRQCGQDFESVMAYSKGEQNRGLRQRRLQSNIGNSCSSMVNPPSTRLPDWAGGTMGQPMPLTQFERPSGREVELSICGVAHGVSKRVDRLKSLGNAIVPQVATLFVKAILHAEGM